MSLTLAPFNPFPGLRPFNSEEAHIFFGRELQTDELLERLRQHRFLAVVGTAGSGKSSLMGAGLLPSLHAGLIDVAGSHWRTVIMRPGSNPISSLALALNASGVSTSEELDPDSIGAMFTETTLRRGALGLVEAAKHGNLGRDENMLVLVDQFEEIFRIRNVDRESQDDSAAFVKLLIEAVWQSELPIYVILTMRSDFLGDCSLFYDLPEMINSSQYLVPRLSREGLRQAIEGPIAVGGGEISPRLVQRLLNEMSDAPHHLPILQHALFRTWESWKVEGSDGPIDLHHYQIIGGMADALSNHADEAYNELPDPGRRIAKKLFQSLTVRGPDNREIRRPLRLEVLCSIVEASPETIATVIDAFSGESRAFIMPPSSGLLRAESVVDISHESLIRGWRQLREWVDEEASSAQFYIRLAETAKLYQRGMAGLWRNPDLELALRWRRTQMPIKAWAELYHSGFEDAMEFLDKSLAAYQEEVRGVELRRKKESRKIRILFTLLFILFFVNVVLFSMLMYQK